MFFKALLAFLALPGLVAFVVPAVLIHFDPWRLPGLYSGGIVLLVGVIALLWCVRDFYVSGKGTLAPWSPPNNLVVIGLYRHTRNPMYVAVVTILLGWALRFGSPLVAAYSVLALLRFHVQVTSREEPYLESTFKESYRKYKSSVPRWIF